MLLYRLVTTTTSGNSEEKKDSNTKDVSSIPEPPEDIKKIVEAEEEEYALMERLHSVHKTVVNLKFTDSDRTYYVRESDLYSTILQTLIGPEKNPTNFRISKCSQMTNAVIQTFTNR